MKAQTHFWIVALAIPFYYSCTMDGQTAMIGEFAMQQCCVVLFTADAPTIDVNQTVLYTNASTPQYLLYTVYNSNAAQFNQQLYVVFGDSLLVITHGTTIFNILT